MVMRAYLGFPIRCSVGGVLVGGDFEHVCREFSTGRSLLLSFFLLSAIAFLIEGFINANLQYILTIEFFRSKACRCHMRGTRGCGIWSL